MLKHKLLTAAGTSRTAAKKTFLAIGMDGATFSGFTGNKNVLVFEFDATSGFGALKFVFYEGALNSPYGLKFTKKGNFLYICRGAGTPYLYRLAFSRSALSQTMVSIPNGYSVLQFGIHPSHTGVVNPLGASPWISGAYVSDSAVGSNLPAPDPIQSVSTVSSAAAEFSPAGDAVVLSLWASPYAAAYRWPWTGTGDALTGPPTATGSGLEGRTSGGMAFTPAADAIALGSDITPYLSAYTWSSAGFGATRYRPTTDPGSRVRALAFSPDGGALAVGTSSGLVVYKWNKPGFGTRYLSGYAKDVYGVAWSPDGSMIAVAYATSPFVSLFPWTGSGFGTRIDFPISLITSGSPYYAKAVAFCEA